MTQHQVETSQTGDQPVKGRSTFTLLFFGLIGFAALVVAIQVVAVATSSSPQTTASPPRTQTTTAPSITTANSPLTMWRDNFGGTDWGRNVTAVSVSSGGIVDVTIRQGTTRGEAEQICRSSFALYGLDRVSSVWVQTTEGHYLADSTSGVRGCG